MRLCATSQAPAVVGIFSHSTTRAFGREWVPAVREKVHSERELQPEEALLEEVKAVHASDGLLLGYCWRSSGHWLMRPSNHSRFFCPDCGGCIKAIPGREEKKASPTVAPDEDDGTLQAEQERKQEREKRPVTSRTWFERKQRWCTCQDDRRNSERRRHGKKPQRAALWTDTRLASTRRKYPSLSFADWSAAMERLGEMARLAYRGASQEQLAQMLLRSPDALAQLVSAAAQDTEEAWPRLLPYIKRYSTPMQRQSSTPQELLLTLAQRHLLIRERLVAEARHLCHWEALFFKEVVERVHGQTGTIAISSKGKTRPSARGIRLMEAPGGAIEVRYGEQIRAYEFGRPPADSFCPYDYLYEQYPGCVAVALVDESHNGRGKDSDIGHAHHMAMLASQTRELTSGTHYGGDIISFYHYWFRFNPSLWRRLGLRWKDATKALRLFGVIQEWTKEMESEARRGNRGQTTTHVSTIPGPGLSARLIPYLLEDLSYLTVLDVGAFMPPRVEIPVLVDMADPEVEAAQEEARHLKQAVHAARVDLEQEKQRLFQRLQAGQAELEELQTLTAREQRLQVQWEEE
ncbi:MAG: hypothetical protein J2P37_35295, partial [Ktedonobacteraceae bacterium]|nr:hypothetical protein [Ktedonobacteraceae bacterium]